MKNIFKKEKTEKPLVIDNFTIIGSQIDGDAIEVIKTVADSLKNLTELFKRNHVEVVLEKNLDIKNFFDLTKANDTSIVLRNDITIGKRISGPKE